MKTLAWLTAFLLITTCAFGQISQTDSLLADINSGPETPVLLPERMLFTQRALWGESGLMRGCLPLSVDNRRKEFRIRRTMFNIHQTTGLLTLAGMIAQGLIGARLYSHYSDDLKQTHQQIARGINIGYTTTALVALTSPPAIVHRKGFSSAKLHRNLAILHLAGMVATNILAQQMRREPSLKPYHRAAAYTTFGAYTLAILSFKFQ